jgi:RimJ/RimL family protein N-acetyltransferase
MNEAMQSPAHLNPAAWQRSFHQPGPWWLEPLAPRHARALARQYRNPRTAHMTGLPEIGAELDAAQWIALRQQESPATFAFMHAIGGFVGYGDLFLSGDEGYLCMWMGEDFRGRGWSKVLVSQLCALGRLAGLSVIWSSAYRDNLASLRCMAAAGFQRLPLQALPPDEERVFVALPFEPRSQDEACRGMVAFCDRTDTGVRFDARPVLQPSSEGVSP